jgi:hypothetical protein
MLCIWHAGSSDRRATQRRKIMIRFDLQNFVSLATASAIALVSTGMLFAATAIPAVSSVAGSVA